MNDYIIEKNGVLNIMLNKSFDCDCIVNTIIDSYEKHKHSKILVETCSDCVCSEYSTLEQFDTGDVLAKYFYGKGVQIAILGKCALFTHFTETVAKNRGLYIKVSDDQSIIMDWIN